MEIVFRSFGPYEIHQQIGSGGMAFVFLATDTRTDSRVALKLVPIESDRDGVEVLEAEQFGARLQEQFCQVSRSVPTVYEYGTRDRYFFIAMEYFDGQNLSDVISHGAVPPARAVKIAIQLCEFLETADGFSVTLDGTPRHSLLHGDLKPRNIRVLADDEIKVFDFGIAKALSLSRRVTRNDFGSIAYLSPERIESGNIDAQSEFWAVGVLLYEMIGGVQPFQAADTRRLEQLIRERRPPASLNGGCPHGLTAIIGKLLAENVTGRYGSAQTIRDDLQRFAAGQTTQAEQELLQARVDDEATRRTRRPAAIDEEATRRTVRPRVDPQPTAAVTPREPVAVPAQAPVPAVAAALPPSRRARAMRLARQLLLLFAFIIVVSDISVYRTAADLSQQVPQDLRALNDRWDQSDALSRRSVVLGVGPLRRALARQTLVLANRTFERYLTSSSTVYSAEWRQVRDAVDHALHVRSSNRELEADLRYCDGHLRRINGEARVKGKLADAAQTELTAAVTAFREAAELRPNWPDPFLGLMRSFVALDDMERAADALTQAQSYGYTAGNRDWAQLADGYYLRGTKLVDADDLESLTRAADAYSHAADHYAKVVGFGNATQRLREAQRRTQDLQERIAALSAPNAEPKESDLSTHLPGDEPDERAASARERQP